MDTSNGKEYPKKQEDDAGRKEVKEERCRKKEVETQEQTVEVVNSVSGPDYQICILLGWAPW
jgi:hypothetical protein